MLLRANPAIFCLVLFCIAPALAPENTFTDRLLQNRYQIAFQDARISGTGAPVLQNALSGAQFVLIGEDHGIAQIPQFVSAVCDLLAPQGFHTMAIETGPLAARALQPWITYDSSPAS